MNQGLSNKIHFAYKIINLFFMNLLIHNLLDNLIRDDFCKTWPSRDFNMPHRKNMLTCPWSRGFQSIFALEMLLVSNSNLLLSDFDSQICGSFKNSTAEYARTTTWEIQILPFGSLCFKFFWWALLVCFVLFFFCNKRVVNSH